MEKNTQIINKLKPKISMKEIEKISYTKFNNKFNSKSKENNILELIMEVLIFNKDCHLVTVFKDYMIWDYIDEFLKRYYNREEGKDRVPRYAHFYRNYCKFFCRPTFRDFEINEIIQDHSEKKAELYYNQNFRKKNDKNKFADDGLFEDDESESIHVSKSKIEKTIFNKTIKKNIEDTSLYSEKNESALFYLNPEKDIINNNNILSISSNNQSIIKIIDDFNNKNFFDNQNQIHIIYQNKTIINQDNKKDDVNINKDNKNKDFSKINKKDDNINKEIIVNQDNKNQESNKKIENKKQESNSNHKENNKTEIKRKETKTENKSSDKKQDNKKQENNNDIHDNRIKEIKKLEIKSHQNNNNTNVNNTNKNINNNNNTNNYNNNTNNNTINNNNKNINNNNNTKNNNNNINNNNTNTNNINNNTNLNSNNNKTINKNNPNHINIESKKQEIKNENQINKPVPYYKFNTHIPSKKNSTLTSCTSLLKKNNSINERNNTEIKKNNTQNLNSNISRSNNKSQIQIIENMKHMYIKSRNVPNIQFYTKNDTQFKNYDLLTNNGKKITNLVKTQNVENLLNKNSKNIYSIDNLLNNHNYNKNNYQLHSTNNIHFSRKMQNKSANNNSSTNFLKNNLNKTKLKTNFSKERSNSNNTKISPSKGNLFLNKNEELVKITLSSLLMNNKGRNNSNNLKQLKTYKVNSSNKNHSNHLINNHSNNQFQEIISSKLNNRINSNEKINVNINNNLNNLNQILNNNNSLKISRNKGRNIDLIPNTFSHQFKSVISTTDKKMVSNTVINIKGKSPNNKNISQGKLNNNISSSQLIKTMGKLKINKPIHLKQNSDYDNFKFKNKSRKGIGYKK